MYLDKSSISNLPQTYIFLPELICPICNGVIINPVQCTKCENCFCDKCISGKVECPKGCGELELRKSKFLLKLLSKLIFKCKNGCEQQILYNDIENHYLIECPKINFQKEIEYLKGEVETLNKDINKITNETKQKLKMLNVNGYNIDELGEGEYYVSKFHPHPLLKDNGKRVSYTCDICRGDSSSLNVIVTYYCKKCDFDYCSYCMKLEQLDEQIY